jgi:hypothetical protein
MTILTLFVMSVSISTYQLLDVTLAAAAQLDSEQRSRFGAASTSLSVPPVAPSGNSKMHTNQIEAISTSEQRGEMVNLQASSSLPPTQLPARIRILMANPYTPIGVIALASGSGAPTTLTGTVVNQVSSDFLVWRAHFVGVDVE